MWWSVLVLQAEWVLQVMWEIHIMYCDSHVLQQVGRKSMIVLWQKWAGIDYFVLMKRLVYLISPEVEVKLVHILGHPTWNELYSCHIYHCQFSPYPWLHTHHLSLAILTRRVGTRIENNYCRQASCGNVHLLRSLVEKRAMKFHVLLIKSVPP